jgi:hypothetical protein
MPAPTTPIADLYAEVSKQDYRVDWKEDVRKDWKHDFVPAPVPPVTP